MPYIANEKLDKLICPFCDQTLMFDRHRDFTYIDRNMTDTFFGCPSKHIYVWYDNDWTVWRSYNEGQTSFVRFQRYDSSLSLGFANSTKRIYLSNFDPFQLSYQALHERAKLYTVFG